jgi:hypothetical protein
MHSSQIPEQNTIGIHGDSVYMFELLKYVRVVVILEYSTANASGFCTGRSETGPNWQRNNVPMWQPTKLHNSWSDKNPSLIATVVAASSRSYRNGHAIQKSGEHEFAARQEPSPPGCSSGQMQMQRRMKAPRISNQRPSAQTSNSELRRNLESKNQQRCRIGWKLGAAAAAGGGWMVGWFTCW